jgi:hypothetical protein
MAWTAPVINDERRISVKAFATHVEAKRQSRLVAATVCYVHGLNSPLNLVEPEDPSGDQFTRHLAVVSCCCQSDMLE